MSSNAAALLRQAGLAAALCLSGAGCEASALRLCNGPQLSPAEQDRLFRYAALIKSELEASGQSIALISRSGLDLSRFGLRYSHAGLSLKSSDNTPWSVRQLYYACDEGKPRLYDQGISGFVLGTDEPAVGYVSIVYLPPAQAAALEGVALDTRRALQVLNARYSANAYPYSLQYQNCNQWVAELLALAWAPLDEGEGARQQAQDWLKAQGYVPQVFEAGWRPLMWFANLLPWLHSDDHPAADLAQAIYRVSMPASIEAFVRREAPGATRVEICHTETRVVIHRGWEAIAAGCVAGEQDTVVGLE